MKHEILKMPSQYKSFPKVLLIGGPDVNARIPIIQSLAGQFSISVLGSNPYLSDAFNQVGINYSSYNLNRGTNPLADILTMCYLARVISQVHPNIVHTFDTKPAVLGRLAAWFAHVPVVIGTLPGLGSLYSQNDSRTRAIRSIYQPLQKLACSISDLTIFQNHEDAEQFIRNAVVPRHKTSIINGSGVQIQIYGPQKFTMEQCHQMRASLGLDETKIVVVMISRLIRSKGVLEFVQAAKSIREKHPDTVFLLVGSDDCQSIDVLTHDERELIAKSVTCLGTRDDVPELLAISDIFVLPTYYREGIPRVLLEAASMGLPIVATNVPGCTEVVEHDANGFLVTPRDVDALRCAIEALVVDSSLRKRFGAVSRQRAITRFDLSIIAGQTAEIYKQLLAEKLHGKQTDS